MKKEIVYIDMDDVLCDYSGSHTKALALNPEFKLPQSQPNFFRNLLPIKDAIESVQKLNERFDVYFLTAPSVRNPLCYTKKRLWIEDHIDGAGQENFEGELLQFGSPKFKDWKAVLGYFKNKHF